MTERKIRTPPKTAELLASVCVARHSLRPRRATLRAMTAHARRMVAGRWHDKLRVIDCLCLVIDLYVISVRRHRAYPA